MRNQSHWGTCSATLSQVTPSSQLEPSSDSPRPALDPVQDVYFATCARGLGEYLAREIEADQVNGEVLDIASSGVRFRASEPGHITGYKACIWLRTAMRVLLELGSGNICAEKDNEGWQNFSFADAIYDFVKNCADWSYFLDGGLLSFSIQVRVSDGNHGKFAHSRRPQSKGRRFNNTFSRLDIFTPGEHTVQVRVKDAICDALRNAGAEKPGKPTSHADADLPLFVVVHGASVTLYRDMAGASLHKRGYRSDAALHRSSLNESVAAGMLYMAGFQPDGSFRCKKPWKEDSRTARKALVIVDPMCGSGTLLIEAALLRLGVAVGLYRESFAFQAWVDFDANAFQVIIGEAVSAQRSDDNVAATFIGNDANPSALALARRDLERTRLSGLVSLHQGDVRELRLPRAPTLTISNPPWGMRIDGENDAWEGLGFFLRKFAAGCTALFLSGDRAVSRGLRMRARRKMPIRIGNVECRALLYDVLPKLEDECDGRGLQRNEEAIDGGQRRATTRRQLPEMERPML